jgi:hypothetical protein
MRYDGEKFSVHVELSFRNGRVGGDDPDFPFTFNIALKRATLTLYLEKPLSVDRNSIARHIPSSQAELSSLVSAKKEIKSNRELGGKVDPASVALTLAGHSAASASQSRERQVKVVQELPRIIAIPHPSGDQQYSWELTPGQSEILDGQPWDPVSEPRLSLRMSIGSKPRIDPVVKAIVSCRLDDIAIDSLQLKDTSVIGTIKEMAFNRVNIAAAVQHLKFTLRDMELEVGALSDAFSHIEVANLIVVEDSHG